MSDCIWLHYSRPRPHWYELPEAERAKKRDAWKAAKSRSREAGGVPLGLYHIRGQHDFEVVELWRFPNAEAAFHHWARLSAAAYNEWFAFSNNIGLGFDET